MISVCGVLLVAVGDILHLQILQSHVMQENVDDRGINNHFISLFTPLSVCVLRHFARSFCRRHQF
jgi:hypothetical protein